MLKINSYLLFLLFATYSISYAQELKSNEAKNIFSLEKNINGDFRYFNIDALGNFLVFTNNNQLIKINNNGTTIAKFNYEKRYGQPTYIDPSNPFINLVFYKNYSIITALDQLLTLRNSINLNTLQLFNTKAIASSYDNNIWIFDDQNFVLKKINEWGKVLLTSMDLRISAENAPSIIKIIDNNNQLYLYDPFKGIFVFDYFGTYKKTIAIINWDNLYVSDNIIYGISNNILHAYDEKTLIQKDFELPEIFLNAKQIIIMNRKVYLLNNQGISIYHNN